MVADRVAWCPGIVALVEAPECGYSPTVHMKMPKGQWQSAEEAEAADADWMAEIGARLKP